MSKVMNDYDLIENSALYFNGKDDLINDWMELFSDCGNVALEKLVEPSNKFAIKNKLPFRVIEAIEQEEDGDVTWRIEII